MWPRGQDLNIFPDHDATYTILLPSSVARCFHLIVLSCPPWNSPFNLNWNQEAPSSLWQLEKHPRRAAIISKKGNKAVLGCIPETSVKIFGFANEGHPKDGFRVPHDSHFRKKCRNKFGSASESSGMLHTQELSLLDAPWVGGDGLAWINTAFDQIIQYIQVLETMPYIWRKIFRALALNLEYRKSSSSSRINTQSICSDSIVILFAYKKFRILWVARGYCEIAMKVMKVEWMPNGTQQRKRARGTAGHAGRWQTLWPHKIIRQGLGSYDSKSNGVHRWRMNSKRNRAAQGCRAGSEIRSSGTALSGPRNSASTRPNFDPGQSSGASRGRWVAIGAGRPDR